MPNVLASAPYSDPASRLNSATRLESFLRKASRWWWKVSDLPSFIPRYVGTGQGGELTFGLSVVKMKDRSHRFRIAEF